MRGYLCIMSASASSKANMRELFMFNNSNKSNIVIVSGIGIIKKRCNKKGSNSASMGEMLYTTHFFRLS